MHVVQLINCYWIVFCALFSFEYYLMPVGLFSAIPMQFSKFLNFSISFKYVLSYLAKCVDYICTKNKILYHFKVFTNSCIAYTITINWTTGPSNSVLRMYTCIIIISAFFHSLFEQLSVIRTV